VATLANRKVIAAERALAVMASHTAHPAAARVMIQRFGRGDLSSLRHAGSNLVAFVASFFLMLCMTKANAECLRERRRPRISAQLMTSAARRNIATLSLCPRAMASITSCVGAESRRDRHSHATTGRSMTRRAANTAHLEMQRVIELHSEALQTRE